MNKQLKNDSKQDSESNKHHKKLCDMPVSEQEARAAAPDNCSVCGEEDPGASLELMVSASKIKSRKRGEANLASESSKQAQQINPSKENPSK